MHLIYLMLYVCLLQDFAESTMNELLGWYGYDKVVDHADTQNLDLQRFTSNSPTGRTKMDPDGPGGPRRPASISSASVSSMDRLGGPDGDHGDDSRDHLKRDSISNSSAESGPSRTPNVSSPGKYL